MKRSQPLSSVLSRSGGLVPRLLGHAHALQRLEEAVLERLPQALRTHCRVANLREATLVLQADSPVWGARLRYTAPALVRELTGSRGLPRVRRIEILVRPAGSKQAEHKTQPRILGAQAARMLREVAASTEDPELRRAWARLATRGSEPES